MARIRSIHPGFFTDEAFVQISAFARLLLIGLGIEADDQGTFAWKPVTLKMRLFPADAIDIQELLAELVEADAIRRYRDNEGREFGAIRNFRIHQRPKSPNAINFIPDDFRNYVGLTDDISPNGGNHSADGGEGRGGGEEDGGERRGRGAGKGSQIPKGFKPVLTDQAKSLIADWPPGRLDSELAKFIDHHSAKGSVMKDWQAAFRTWLRNAKEWGDKNGAGNRGRSGGFQSAIDAARHS